jgi:hypothetical protein
VVEKDAISVVSYHDHENLIPERILMGRVGLMGMSHAVVGGWRNRLTAIWVHLVAYCDRNGYGP